MKKSGLGIIIIFIIAVISMPSFAEMTRPSQQAEIFSDCFFIKGDTSQQVIALTFDDGPDKRNTPQILDILKENDIKATFFLLGKNIKKYPEITKRISKEGHQLANHSWSHSNFHNLADDYILENEIKPTSAIIEKITGEYPQIIRPPYGLINNSTVKILKEEEWQVVIWSIDSYDWLFSQEKIIESIKKNHHQGGIILLHSSYGNQLTAESLPGIIEILKEKEYEFVTVNQLLEK